MRSMTGCIQTRLVLSILCAVIVMSANPASATMNLNGSFEDGAESPSGWTRHPGGFIGEDGHTGARSIGGRARTKATVWTSDVMEVEAGQSWRISGWFRVKKGLVFLRTEFLNSAGAVLGSADTPEIAKDRHASGWRYTAVETDAPASAEHVRMSLIVRGEALCDDIVMTPLIANLLYNPTFEAGSRGRVTFWDPDPVLTKATAKSGSGIADETGGRNGGGLRIRSDSSWWAMRNIQQPIPAGLTTFRLSGWARWEGEAPDIAIAWTDNGGVLHGLSPATPCETVNGWTRFEVSDAHPPVQAETMTVSLVGNIGTAWFDDFQLEPVAPATNLRRVVKVHVNQVGYERNLAKSCVVATNFVPHGGRNFIEVHGEDGHTLGSFPLVGPERIHNGMPDDWGEYFWRADFSSLKETGRCTITAVVGGVRGESYPFLIGDGILFGGTAPLGVEFFFVQRCGFAVPGWHAACHLDDALLPDGTHIDAVGGWHSAGDYNKLMYENGDGGVLYALTEAFRTKQQVFEASDRDNDGVPDILDEARWGADFVVKMQVPETGGLRKDVSQGPGRTWMKWCPPEVHTDNIIGTDDDPVILPGEGNSPLAIGGWMRLAGELERRGEDGSKYRSSAERLWGYSTQNGETGFSPLNLLSALDLHAATGERRYAEFASRCVDTLLASQVPSGRHAGAFGAFGEHAAGALGTYALRFPEDSRIPRIRVALARYIDFCLTTAENPFGLAKQSVGEQDFFFEPTSTLGHNFEILARAWSAIIAYQVTGQEDALTFALDQIDWVMGKNPYGLCMMEGAGSNNPPRYHHRYDSIPGHERGAVPGAIPNGFVRTPRALDQPGFDMSRSRTERDHPSYRTSEPWLVHNMWHLLAVSALQRVVDERAR